MDIRQYPVIDWDQAISLAGNQKELAKELLDLLLTTLQDDLIKMQTLQKEQNIPELIREVHKLHGALCYCGLPRLKILISRLETDLKNNIMESSAKLLDQLDTEISLLLEQHPDYS